MKTILSLVLFSLATINVFAVINFDIQNDTLKTYEDSLEFYKRKPVDVETDIVLFDNLEVLYVDVKKIDESSVYFSFPGETNLHKLKRTEVTRVKYKSGEMEDVEDYVSKEREVKDYRKIRYTWEPEDVEGMIEVGEVEAKAEGNNRGISTAKSLERSAIIVLKRKAALLDADYVLITDKHVHVAFGEIPSTTLKGKAYKSVEKE